MVAKRGVELEAVYFHAPPYTSERAKEKVIDLARLVSAYSGPIKLHIVNFTDIQLAIYEKCPHDELTIIMRRYMMRIAEHFAKKNGCLGLVTGESIGQVASQTMRVLRRQTLSAHCRYTVRLSDLIRKRLWKYLKRSTHTKFQSSRLKTAARFSWQSIR